MKMYDIIPLTVDGLHVSHGINSIILLWLTCKSWRKLYNFVVAYM